MDTVNRVSSIPSPPPPPPPPPPEIIRTASSSSSCASTKSSYQRLILLPQLDTPKPRSKMKSLNWSKIPAQKVVESCISKNGGGANNLWSLMASTTGDPHGPLGGIKVDFDLLEGLFCQPAPKSAPNSKPGSPMVQRRGGFGRDDNHNLLTSGLTDLIHSKVGSFRKGGSSSDGNSSSNGGEKGSAATEINLLDGKKSLNINIFLKQFRSSPDDLVSMINDGDHMYIGPEGLNNLMKLLPTDDEVNMLKNNSSNYYRMAVAEKFLFQLIQIPNYKLRIECMLLKEEYESNVSYLEPSIGVIKSAAREIQESQSLREVLYLVLVAGNFLNSGGYAGDAAGFKMMSLLKLAEIRANKPGISLIHFVAQQTEQNHGINFDESSPPNPPTTSTNLPLFQELQSLEEASKISVDSLKMEINQLASKISRIKTQMKDRSKGCDSENKFFKMMSKFISECDHEVTKIEKKIKKHLEATRIELASFLCEDPNEFKFEDCFKVFNSFLQQFKNALEDNRKRRENEMKQEARKQQHRMSIASTNSSGSGGGGVKGDLDSNGSHSNKSLLRPQSLELSGELDSTLFEFLTSTSHDGSEGNLFGSTLRRSGRRSRGWNKAGAATGAVQDEGDSRERSCTSTVTNTTGVREESLSRTSSLRAKRDSRRSHKNQDVTPTTKNDDDFCNSDPIVVTNSKTPAGAGTGYGSHLSQQQQQQRLHDRYNVESGSGSYTSCGGGIRSQKRGDRGPRDEGVAEEMLQQSSKFSRNETSRKTYDSRHGLVASVIESSSSEESSPEIVLNDHEVILSRKGRESFSNPSDPDSNSELLSPSSTSHKRRPSLDRVDGVSSDSRAQRMSESTTNHGSTGPAAAIVTPIFRMNTYVSSTNDRIDQELMKIREKIRSRNTSPIKDTVIKSPITDGYALTNTVNNNLLSSPSSYGAKEYLSPKTRTLNGHSVSPARMLSRLPVRTHDLTPLPQLRSKSAITESSRTMNQSRITHSKEVNNSSHSSTRNPFTTSSTNQSSQGGSHTLPRRSSRPSITSSHVSSNSTSHRSSATTSATPPSRKPSITSKTTPSYSALRYQTPLPKTSLVMKTNAKNALAPEANFRRASLTASRRRQILGTYNFSSSTPTSSSYSPSTYSTSTPVTSYRTPTRSASMSRGSGGEVRSFMKQTSSSAAKSRN